MTPSKELIEQRDRCATAFHTAEADLAGLLERQKKLDAALDDAVRASLRTGDPSAEAEARRRLLKIDVEIDQARRRARLVRGEMDRIEFDIREATAHEQQALRAKAAQLSGEIEREMRADKKLRASILESMGLYWVAYGGNGATPMNWGGHLTDLFPEPDAAEFAPIVADAKIRLGID